MNKEQSMNLLKDLINNPNKNILTSDMLEEANNADKMLLILINENEENSEIYMRNVDIVDFSFAYMNYLIKVCNNDLNKVKSILKFLVKQVEDKL